MAEKLLSIQSLKNNLSAQRDGAWENSRILKGVRFKVRSTSYPDFVTERAEMARDLARRYKGDPIHPDKLVQVTGDLVAKHILLDWDGLAEKYDPELAVDLLTNAAYPTFQDAVLACAEAVGQANIEYVEAAAKN